MTLQGDYQRYEAVSTYEEWFHRRLLLVMVMYDPICHESWVTWRRKWRIRAAFCTLSHKEGSNSILAVWNSHDVTWYSDFEPLHNINEAVRQITVVSQREVKVRTLNTSFQFIWHIDFFFESGSRRYRIVTRKVEARLRSDWKPFSELITST